jgi:hypothetical protein
VRIPVCTTVLSLIALFVFSGAQAADKIVVSGKKYKTDVCERGADDVVPALPDAARNYLTIVCARGSQVIIANPPWVFSEPDSQVFSLLPFSMQGKFQKGVSFTFINIRSLSAETAKAEFLSHYENANTIGGRSDAIFGEISLALKAVTETFLSVRTLGDTSLVIELVGPDELRHELFLFINGENEFSAGLISQYKGTYGVSTSKGTILVHNPS